MYDVHLFAIVRRKFPGIVADSPAAAVALAQQQPSVLRWLNRLNDQHGVGEFAEGFSEYLVDETDHAGSTWSQRFYPAESDLLAPLRRLIRWDETGRCPDELQQLLHGVQSLLVHTL